VPFGRVCPVDGLSKLVGQGQVVVDGFQILRLYAPAEAHCEAPSPRTHELGDEQRESRPPPQKSQDLKRQRVASVYKQREHMGFAASEQERRPGGPGFVGNPSVSETEMGYLAGGENNETVSPAEPFDGPAYGSDVVGGPAGRERVDADQPLLRAGQFAEGVVDHDAQVGSDRRQGGGGQQSVQYPVRVVGDYQQRPGSRDPGGSFAGHSYIDAEAGQAVSPEG